jgi:glucosyl-dolichyl phosphate glucuronosyltransferase
MDLTVVIATRNRAECLKTTLQTITQQSLSPQSYEIIVVDNGSSDNTHDVVLEVQSSSPNVRYAFEMVPGLSSARNLGIEQTRGEVICFVDDDVIADFHYLEYLLAAFHANGHVEAVGGRVLAFSTEAIPSYLIDLPSLSTTMDYGETPFYFNDVPGSFPFGVSMAFRKEVFARCGLFKVGLGRTKKKLLAHEELDLFNRIMEGKRNCLYEPRALLYHVILPERMTLSFALRWYFWFGVSDGILYTTTKPCEPVQAWAHGRLGMWTSTFGRGFFKNITLRNLLHRVYLIGVMMKMVQCTGLSSERERNG